MPPRPKYSRDQIIEAAYELTRAEGIEAISARTIAKKLKTTATPIFTFFSGMDELKQEVYRRAKQVCLAYLGESVHYFPAFKEFGMRWIRFAVEEPQLYRLLFLDGSRHAETPGSLMAEFSDLTGPVLQSICSGFGLGLEDARRLLDQMILHANGIALFLVDRPDYLDEAEISRLISENCIGLVLLLKIRNGNFDPAMAERMANATEIMPVRVDESR